MKPTNSDAPTAVDAPSVPLELWPHQRQALSHVLSRDASYLSMAMGTGKSKVCIEQMAAARRELSLIDLLSLKPPAPGDGQDEAGIDTMGHTPSPRALRVLILCPKAVVPVWPEQIRQHLPRSMEATVYAPMRETVTARAARVSELWDRAAHGAWKWTSTPTTDIHVVVLNYEAARRWPLGPDTPGRNRRNGALLRGTWDLVILDEAHRVKRPSGPTHRLIKRLARVARRRVCLSGTPFPQGPIDAFAQFLFLEPDGAALGTSYLDHRREYCEMGGPLQQWVKGPRNVEQFAEQIAPWVYSCDDAVVDLPSLTVTHRHFALGRNERKAYDQMEAEFIAWVNGQEYRAANALTKMLRLQQVTSGYLDPPPAARFTAPPGSCEAPPPVRAILGNSRISALNDLLDDLAPDEPVCLFTRFTAETDACLATLHKRRGSEPDEISGRRNTVGARWTPGPANSVVAQIQSGSLGIDLTASRFAIFVATTFDLAAYEQAKKRIHRPGQGGRCTAIHLIATDTIDGVAMKALSNKLTVSETIATYFKEAQDA